MSLSIASVYDNGGKTIDRYTVFYFENGRFDPDSCHFIGLSDHPEHPQGFSQIGIGMLGAHNGKLIEFNDLPRDVQDHVRKRLGFTGYKLKTENERFLEVQERLLPFVRARLAKNPDEWLERLDEETKTLILSRILFIATEYTDKVEGFIDIADILYNERYDVAVDIAGEEALDIIDNPTDHEDY